MPTMEEDSVQLRPPGASSSTTAPECTVSVSQLRRSMAISAVFAFVCGAAAVFLVHPGINHPGSAVYAGGHQQSPHPVTSSSALSAQIQAEHTSEVSAPDTPTFKMTTEIPEHITTKPIAVTNVGTFRFTDGMPDAASVELAYDTLDHQRAVDVFLNFVPAASLEALRLGIASVFPETKAGQSQDQNWAILSGLLDSRGLFLTGNTDTVYATAFVDLSNDAPSGAEGAVVVEIPPKCGPSTVNDAYFRFVVDMGGPGPDRGAGGKYLLLGPDYKGSPDFREVLNGEVATVDGEEYFIAHSPSYVNWVIARGFTVDGSTAPATASFESGVKVYPFNQRHSRVADHGFPMKWKNISNTYFNTIHANDATFYDELDTVLQREPAEVWPPETLGLASSIGMRRGAKFAPDARMGKLLTSAVATGNAIARSLAFRPRDDSCWMYGKESAWYTPFVGGNHEWLIEGGNGGRNLDARTFFFYVATVNTPAMVLKMVGRGSQYGMIALDADKEYLDGGKDYTLTVPKDVPAKEFWSVVIYDTQTRSELQTGQQYPSVNSQRKGADGEAVMAANADGTTAIYFGPAPPADASKKGNWLQTIPGKSWFALLRLYGPLESFFDKSWRPGEIEKGAGASEDTAGVVGKPASPVSLAGANRRNRRNG